MRFLTWSLLSVITVPALQSQAPVHVESPAVWSHAPITNAVLDDRLSGAASQYARLAPIPRVAFYDIAYPKDANEYAALGGSGLLVVAAVAQDSADLPFKSVYVRSITRTDTLRLVAAAMSYISADNIRTTFGRYRLDAMYLIPIAVRVASGDLLVDFNSRREFRLAHLGGPLPPAVQAYAGTAPTQAGVDTQALWEMAKREYPDLSSSLQGGHH